MGLTATHKPRKRATPGIRRDCLTMYYVVCRANDAWQKEKKMNHPTLQPSSCHHLVTICHNHGKGTVNREMERGVANQRGSKILLHCCVILPASDMSSQK